MRTIKFRGKTLEDAGLRKAGEWAYGGYFVDYCYGGCSEGKHHIVEWNSTGMGYFAHTLVEKESVGQFTGLKDKHGKEIYEGDLVKTHDQNNVIEYRHGSFMIIGLHEDKYERTYSRFYHYLIDSTIPHVEVSRFDGVTTTLEVIGNRFENPELLEGESHV
ncbi:YopX family protein [Virgibacillus sp. YIM 98842]|uniref:YopX family protein n=1 Tax=Virgibacillus sp. YIM 98842 TaxID=2663533 RepID=UPI0013DAF7AE|nr:YopX family protein [Virgibacillus sp. YIM 98842]